MTRQERQALDQVADTIIEETPTLASLDKIKRDIDAALANGRKTMDMIRAIEAHRQPDYDPAGMKRLAKYLAHWRAHCTRLEVRTPRRGA